eukprot:Amastigsp_a341449_100.p3 type:complete len:172 gc:universal Amastigsp_a341449_100:923-408(-)
MLCTFALESNERRGHPPGRGPCGQRHESRESADGDVRRHRRPRRADPRNQGGDRAAALAPRAVRGHRHQAAQRRHSLWSPRHGQDHARARRRQLDERHVPPRRGLGAHSKVPRGGAQARPRALPRRRGVRAVDCVHRRDRRRRLEAVQLDVGRRERDPTDHARAAQPARRL